MQYAKSDVVQLKYSITVSLVGGAFPNICKFKKRSELVPKLQLWNVIALEALLLK